MEEMKKRAAVVVLAGIVLAAVVLTGCKKRYFPRIQEQVVDPGVAVQEEWVVE